MPPEFCAIFTLGKGKRAGTPPFCQLLKEKGIIQAMDTSIFLVSLPAVIALLCKVGIFIYARALGTHSRLTRLYLYFLFALSIQNIAEISHFYTLARGAMPYLEFTVFYTALILAVAFLLHLAIAISFRSGDTRVRYALTGVYMYAGVLAILLIFTPWVIADLVRLSYTASRIPGPLFPALEVFVVGGFLGAIGIFIRGARRQDTPLKRAKAAIMLLAIIPMATVMITVFTMLHFNIRLFNATIINPIAITFFLVVTVYAIHQHRLFDIQFFIPWSKVRQRKTAFYDRIRAMISEIADLGSVREATHRLADTLGCSVALVSTGKPVLAVAGGAQEMVAFPLEQLRNINRIVVANEIADTAPETYTIMRQHGVAAVVPFYPHSQNASGWMLLGDSFSEQVYTPLDFKMVEQLFDKMAELFLNKLLVMRGQLAAAERRLQTMEFRLQEAETGIAALRGENETLQKLNLRLAREQAADSLLMADVPKDGMLPNIVLLGRDKPLLKRLRRFFPQADQFVGPDSASFRRQNLPDVLICRVDADKDTHAQWLTLIAQLRGRAALLLHGDGAHEFITAHLDALAGTLVEVMPEDITDEAVVRRIQALAGLRRAMCAVTDPNCPLVGVSQVFHETMLDAARLASFTEPVLIESHDATECVAVARYLYETGGRSGSFQIAPASDANIPEHSSKLFATCQNGTLLLTNLETLGTESREQLLTAIKNAAGVRIVLAVTMADEPLRTHFRSFALRLPTLRERRLDLPLLVHYFTLQYNLRAGVHAYLTQAEVDDLVTTQYPESMHALKTTVFERLNAKHRRSAHIPEMEFALTEKPLEEHVAAFEARLIEQTLKRCQGNKSKAARLLGLRPNTLHYKIERYGLGDPKGKPGNN
ncbi:MAG: hypothetical protein HY082_10660 [Gammaproteobacteria bacterium]|nr:hypothetical protein [Gammaproteobacteria bacterium]